MLFTYKALHEGKIINGKIEAQVEDEAIAYLKKNGYFPIEIKKRDSSNSILGALFDKVNFNDIVDLTRQLAIMLNAGLTIIDCFDILKKQLTKPSLLNVVENIDRDVRGGKSFSTALRRYPQHFSNLYIALVKSGEASGKLSDILIKLAENLEKQREFRGKIKGALIYPAIVIVGMLMVMFIMITFVVPRLLNLYKDFNIDLPFTTKILIALSSFSVQFWPLIIIGVVGGVIFVKRYSKTKAGKMQIDKLQLRAPVFSNIIKMAVLVDSTRTLAILIASGVSILDSLSIVIETTDNFVYQQAFTNIYKQVEKGVSIGQAMSNEGVFPPILIQMTTVGEQTGHLDDTLQRISHYFEMESEIAVKTLTTLIEPTILVVLGVGVGFLVLAVITPIYNLTGSFQ
jgi:type IV pilus assembly protein PilC